VSVGEGGEEEMRDSFGVRRCHQETPLAVDRMIQVVYWFHLVQDRGQWQASVSSVMNFLIL
jgi:hypothetical protein